MRKDFSRSTWLFAVLAFFFSLNSWASAEFVPDELIVKFSGSAHQTFSAQGTRSASTAASVLSARLGAGTVLSIQPLKTDPSLHKVKIAPNRDMKKVLSVLRDEASIQYAEPNYIYRISSVDPDDVEFARQWSLKNTGQKDEGGQIGTPGADIDVTRLWGEGMTGSRAVKVAVIDTGVDWTHPDLVDNLLVNPGEAGENSNNGVDDDGNGFVDDVMGWNFYANTNNSSDDHSHGTHCAGIIGASGNNALGISGVNWQVSILPIKFLSDSGGGTLEGAIEAVNYARLMNVDIMSNSWGGGGYSKILEDSVREAEAAGILFVAAAGNDGTNNDNLPTYPASFQVSNVVSVAASDNQDKLARFTNYGRNTVHVAAPGVKVYSTIKGGEYKAYSGTSMACPHVAGLAALMLSHNSSLSFAELKERIIRTSVAVPAMKRKVIANGRVNAYNALHGIVPPSDEPDPSLWKDVEYALESKHPYDNNTDEVFTIEQPGVKYIRVVFDRVEVEHGYDRLTVIGGDGVVVDEITGTATDYVTEYIKGDRIAVRLKADHTMNKWGFKISRIQVITE